MPAITASHATVLNENCTLHYWHHPNPTKPLLIFVPGGNGHGRQFLPIMEILSDQYETATFDRRQMSASISTAPGFYNPVQQARDVIAVMHAVSRTTTSLFTSSGGGFIGLQLAASYPAVLDHLIIHEAPILSLLPAAESTALIDLSFELRALYKREGVEKAMEKFQEGMVGMDDGLPMAHPGTANQVNQYEYELPWMALYCPDLEKVKGCSVLVCSGAKSRDASYVRTMAVLAERLACDNVVFPGHHQGFETEAEAFAIVLRGALEKVEEKRGAGDVSL